MAGIPTGQNPLPYGDCPRGPGDHTNMGDGLRVAQQRMSAVYPSRCNVLDNMYDFANHQHQRGSNRTNVLVKSKNGTIIARSDGVSTHILPGTRPLTMDFSQPQNPGYDENGIPVLPNNANHTQLHTRDGGLPWGNNFDWLNVMVNCYGNNQPVNNYIFAYGPSQSGDNWNTKAPDYVTFVDTCSGGNPTSNNDGTPPTYSGCHLDSTNLYWEGKYHGYYDINGNFVVVGIFNYGNTTTYSTSNPVGMFTYGSGFAYQLPGFVWYGAGWLPLIMHGSQHCNAVYWSNGTPALKVQISGVSSTTGNLIPNTATDWTHAIETTLSWQGNINQGYSQWNNAFTYYPSQCNSGGQLGCSVPYVLYTEWNLNGQFGYVDLRGALASVLGGFLTTQSGWQQYCQDHYLCGGTICSTNHETCFTGAYTPTAVTGYIYIGPFAKQNSFEQIYPTSNAPGHLLVGVKEDPSFCSNNLNALALGFSVAVSAMTFLFPADGEMAAVLAAGQQAAAVGGGDCNMVGNQM
ncbi:hypothetical protein HDU76_005766 [Blyttiomyces sp. JEL0837]|nr:hypothetical protein HDU76_005766 [Blyttiomyces sp. JEL0837]